jgi:hypothetical protein
MITSHKIIDLPISGAGCGIIDIHSDGVQLIVRLSDGEIDAGTILFDEVAAFRFRGEMHSLGYADGSYDTVVEIINSIWLSELIEIEPEQIHRTVRGSHHFAILLSNNGYLEVVAKSVFFQGTEGRIK